MACFVCNQYGHWSRNCPNAKCSYCDLMGHSINACPLKEQFKTQLVITSEPITRTRTKKTAATLDDILYNNHITVSNTMKDDIDNFIKYNYSHRGIVDEDRVAESVFNDEIVYNPADNGHLSVLGYIIAKYCDVSNDNVKNFLRKLSTEINNPTQFKYILNSRFSTSPVHIRGAMHFRKLSGYSV